MNPAKTEHKAKPVNNSGEVIEDSFGFCDALLFEPVQHTVKFWMLERDPRQDRILEVNHWALGLTRCAALGAVVVAGNT